MRVLPPIRVITPCPRRYAFDDQRYRRYAALTASATLLLRAATMPPGWIFGDPRYRRQPDPPRPPIGSRDANSWRRVGRAYQSGRLLSAVLVVMRLLRGRAPSFGETAPLLCSELILAREVRGFSPYYQHAYAFIAMLQLYSRRPGCVSATGAKPPTAAYLPMAVYLGAALAKLSQSARSWLVTGDIVENAIDLYSPSSGRWWLRVIPARYIARLVLAFELAALPASALDVRAFRVISLAAILFHACNFHVLRVSFWHLAVLHVPTIMAIRRRPERACHV